MITAVETTTQVLVKAYTTLYLEDFTMQVKSRSARIKKAKVYWFYEEGTWNIDFVHVWGPVIRKSDGAESTQHVSENTYPARSSAASYGIVTPQEIITAALEYIPDWEPKINNTKYPRVKNLKSSL